MNQVVDHVPTKKVDPRKDYSAQGREEDHIMPVEDQARQWLVPQAGCSQLKGARIRQLAMVLQTGCSHCSSRIGGPRSALSKKTCSHIPRSSSYASAVLGWFS